MQSSGAGGKLATLEERYNQLRKDRMHTAVEKEESAVLVSDPTYMGPHVPQVPTYETVMALIKAFQMGVKLHVDYVVRILNNMHDQLKQFCGTVMRTRVPKDGKLIVVGDTHGQLADVLTIFQLHGFPSETNVFVFNGDFVDRGPQGLEIILLLFTMHMASPSTLFLNRGNHEQRYMNERYSFEKEVREKYNPTVFDLAQRAFKYLPLITLINDRVIVVHGGLSDVDFSLDEIAKFPRINIPHVKRKHKHHKHKKQEQQEPEQEEKRCKLNEEQQEIVKCLLWSDPVETEGFTRPSFRGTGVEWGPDVTPEFLKGKKMDYIIRSHEVKDDGFEWDHNDKVLTLFSASNYGSTDNKGAVAVFTDKTHNHVPDASPFPLPECCAFAVNQDKAETKEVLLPQIPFFEESIKRVKRIIFMKRHALVLDFEKVDANTCGCLPFNDFIQVLSSVIPLKWPVLLPYISSEVKDNGILVNYCQFLDQYKVKVEGCHKKTFPFVHGNHAGHSTINGLNTWWKRSASTFHRTLATWKRVRRASSELRRHHTASSLHRESRQIAPTQTHHQRFLFTIFRAAQPFSSST
eukprot:TRINITY_DN3810_c0_g1_i2.p1 TRINITY_DN3810_c0_g1~~TRINITY_DN3810_c0_g1_i2.p1  ORF type:complete len:632 (-),score=158.61 TRINITY_DN3810_c0_g1_i2:2-1732(-)